MKALYPASPGPLVHTGAGKLLALLISHDVGTVQNVTVYDSTTSSGTELLTICVEPERSPVLIEFPRDVPITFATGLYLYVPANVYAYAWAIGFDV